MELNLLLTDGEIAALQLLRHCVQSVVVVKVDERGLLVLHLIQSRGLLKLPTQISELVIAPYLLNAERCALLLIPGVVEVQRRGVGSFESLSGGSDRLMVSSLRRLLRVVGLLLKLRLLSPLPPPPGQTSGPLRCCVGGVLRIARRDIDLRVEMRIVLCRLPKSPATQSVVLVRRDRGRCERRSSHPLSSA